MEPWPQAEKTSRRAADTASDTVRAVTAEALGTGLLLIVVVGSGIMAAQLAGGNDAIALLANAIATGAGLFVLIAVFAPASGAHFNPVVTGVMAAHGRLDGTTAVAYMFSQAGGALVGVVAAHAMFELPLVQAGTDARTGAGQWLGEFIATGGLVLAIVSLARREPGWIPAVVAAWITGAYWFTSSTSFANPAVTLGRALTDTFTGIRPIDVPGFVLAQIAGGACGALLARWMARD